MRLLIHVEGETEETFVNEALAPHLYTVGYQSASARLLGNTRLRQRRGGIRGWDSVRKDITRHLLNDSGARSTTMVDFYGLPASGSGAWPGRRDAATALPNAKAELVEQAIQRDIEEQLGGSLQPGRFIPYVVMHEFEGLLFSDCERFSSGIGKPALKRELQTIRDRFDTPEDINDSPVTAPSKRVVALVPGYTKPLMGTLAVLEIGLARIRAECPRFDSWLKRLEAPFLPR